MRPSGPVQPVVVATEAVVTLTVPANSVAVDRLIRCSARKEDGPGLLLKDGKFSGRFVQVDARKTMALGFLLF